MEANLPRDYADNLNAAVKALEGQFPVSYGKKELRLSNVTVEKLKDPTDTKSQKVARVQGKRWGVGIRGTVSLFNNGKKVSEESLRLVNVPVPTSRWSYIVNNSEYYPVTQNRLKPGVYVNRKQTGETSAFYNLSRGRNFEVQYSPEKQTFTMKYGATNLPMYHVMKAVGVSDDDMRDAWGADVLAKNAATKPQLGKLLSAAGVEHSDANAAGLVRDLFGSMEMSAPEVNEMTIGIKTDKVGGHVLLRSTRKLRNVVQGKELPDRRDSLEYRWFMNMPAFVEERISRSGMTGKFKYRMAKTDDVKSIMGGSSPFDKSVWNIFGGSGIADRAPQTNPYAELNAVKRVSIMGEGGISNPEAITEAARSVYPTFVGVVDPVVTPESEKAGAVYPLSIGAQVKNKEPAVKVRAVGTGDQSVMTIRELFDTPYALVDEYAQAKKAGRPVRAFLKGKVEDVPASRVKYVMDPSKTFSEVSLSSPFATAASPNRLEMVSRHLTSAIALKDREVPLVLTMTDKGKITEKVIGDMVVMKSPVDGVVSSVSKDAIKVRDKGGKLHKVHVPHMFPLNDGRSVEHHVPIVEKGQKVRKGERITEANTTKEGFVAMGVNGRVGYMADGFNFEDGITISQSFADKLTSTAIAQKFYDEDAEVDELLFSRTVRPLSKEERDTLDDGVVKPGTVVREGQILVAGVKRQALTKEERLLGKKLGMETLRDASIVWDRQTPGIVKEVEKTPGGYYIAVAVEEVAKPGDKLSGRHGNKGVIAKIKPDDEMPTTKDGKPLEILLNPVGIGGRMNVSQMYETLVGKVAAKKGNPIAVSSFSGGKRMVEVPGHYRTYWEGDGAERKQVKKWIEPYSYERDFAEEVAQLLKENGLSDTEEVFADGKKLGNILVGRQYILKLIHQSEHKMNARGAGYPYSYASDGTPVKGDDVGEGDAGKAQSADRGMTMALLAHGATENVRELLTYKGDKDNDEVWRAIQLGQTLPAPRVPRIFHKFEAYLNAAGLDLEREGDEMWLLPMTNKEILENSNGELTKTTMFSGKTGKAKAGELFDEKITGGLDGTGWGHVALPYAIPNPVFISPISKILGITKDDVIATGTGQKSLEKDERGNWTTVGPKDGMSLEKALKSVDVAKEYAKPNQDPNRKKYLRALKQLDTTPDIYMLKNVPVIPPVFRPISPMKGRMIISDLNMLYSDLIATSNTLKGLKKETPELMDAEEGLNVRGKLYADVSALYGLGKTEHYREAKGIFQQLHGTGSVKLGMLHHNVMRRRQDLSGRAVIVPGPRLSIDEVGVPREMLRGMYQPFVVKELATLGLTPLAAKKLMDESPEDPLVNTAIDRAIADRPLWMKRDPVLHKFGVMAFKPVPTNDNVVEFHPLVTSAYNADFDGDQVGLFVPVSDEAVAEAKRSMPSKLLRSPATGEIMYTPTHEALLGLFDITAVKGTKAKAAFGDVQAALAAHKKGSIEMRDRVRIGGKDTTLGRSMIEGLLPPKMKGFLAINQPQLNKKRLRDLAEGIGKHDSARYGKVMDGLKDIGFEYSYRSGASVALSDLRSGAAMKSSRAKLLKELQVSKDRPKAAREIAAKLNKVEFPKDNNFTRMSRAGLKPTQGNLQQMLMSPIVGDWGDGNITPVRKSFAEGMNSMDYWSIAPTARKAVVQSVNAVRIPGDITKQMLASSMDAVIVDKDCGSTGSTRPLSDAMDRVMAKSAAGVAAGTIIGPDEINKLRSKGMKQVQVRTPLGCKHAEGICKKCYGMTETGPAQVGENVGVKAAQSMGERGTQLTLRAFHTGGFGELPPMDQVTSLLRLPEKLPNKAAVSPTTGKIVRVERTGDGTYFHVQSPKGIEKSFAPVGRTSVVKKGQSVKAGEALSTGLVDPREVLTLTKSLPAAQRSLTDSLTGIYGKFGIDPRHIEVLVRSMTNLAVVDDPGTSGRIKGEYVPFYWASDWNKSHNGSLKVTPVLKGVTSLPQHRDSWLESIGYRGVKQTMIKAAATGEKASVHGLHPVPAWITGGAEFGKPKRQGKPGY